MKKTFKSISLIIGLFGISIGQSILPPTFSEDSLKFSANWTISTLKEAKIKEVNIDPAVVDVSIASDDKLVHNRYTKYYSFNNLYRISYQPISAKKGLFRLYFKKLPKFELMNNDSLLTFAFDHSIDNSGSVDYVDQGVIPDTVISVNFNNIGMADVLKTLSFRYGLNLINTSDFTGPVSISAQNVAFKTIFNTIIETNRLAWYSVDNVIIVSDAEFLSSIKNGLVTEVIHLNYIDSPVVVSSFSDQLSQRGVIKGMDVTSGKGSGSMNKVLITDTAENLRKIKKLISTIDVKPKQINIAVKFIETSLQSDERLGIDWTQRAQLSGPTSPPDSGAAAVGMGSWGEFVMAKMDLPLYQVVIEALESDNQTKLLQEPQVTTFDNYKANIKVGTSLPVLVPQGEGSVFGTNPYTFENVNVDISLNVIPRINSSNEITMNIDTQVSAIINYVGPDKDRPVISSRNAQTNVVVANGETLMIGGLILEDTSDSFGRVPFLSKVPLIKSFFTMKTNSDQQRELLIFITPSIIG